MTVTSERKAATFCRSTILGFVLAVSAFAGVGALAQTAVVNTATVAPPAGVVDSNPDNDSDDALISVTAPLPPFDSCDATMYLAQDRPTALYQFNTSSNPIVVQPIGSTSSYTYNAVAFNPDDNYLYAISSTNNLLRIGSDGNVADLGTVANLPQVAGQEYNAAEITPDGSFYVRTNQVYNGLYRIDLASTSATAVPLSQALSVADLAWHNGLLYTVDNQNSTLTLYAINPTSGQVTPVGPTGLTSSGFGALFGASNGVYGGLNAGGFYRFDLTTGQATLISDLPGSGNNDGAKCATTPLEFPADLAIDKDDGSDTYVPGEDVVYTIVVSNLGPFGVQGATVNDPLPAGITTASWTCGSATGGGSCGVANGTGAIADAPVNLPADATVTFTLTLSVPADYTGELINVATVTSPDGSPDPNPDNNTDDDINTAEPAVVTVEKTSDPMPGETVTMGQTITYTLTATIAGGVTSDVVTLTDTLSAGLTFGEVTDAGDFTCSGALQCTLPAGTPSGTYALTYTAVVGLDAGGTVSNAVVPTGGDDPTCGSCETQHPVQPGFGTCDATMYLAQDVPTRLFRFDTSSNPFIVDPVGPATGVQYNAIAISPIDNYMYGISGPAPGRVVRVGSDGSVVDLGTVAGFPENSVSGEIGPDGTFYVATSTTLYRINLQTMTATSVALSQSIGTLDMAWHNGLLYTAVDSSNLYAINPANGNVTTIGLTGTTGPFGGMFGATNGVFGSNNNGGFYRFDLTTGAATLISDLQGSGSNDGALCVDAALEFPADLAIDKDDGSDTYVPGEDVVYTIVVSNLGPFGVQGATVNDPLPDGITDATWTCGGATGGGVCGVASGSGAIVDAPVDLPANATVTFTLTMPVPSDFTGELTNTATVTSPEGSPDPNPDNNTDSDTNESEIPAIATAKTADPEAGAEVRPGDLLTYTITVTVAGAPTTELFQFVDTLGAGLTFGEITDAGDFTCSGELTCSLPAGTAQGTYAVTYTATVDANATGSVGNSVAITDGGGDPDPECAPCEPEHPIEPPIPSDIPILSCSSTGNMLNTAYDAATGGMLTSGLDPYWSIAMTTANISGAPPADLTYTAATVVSTRPAPWMASPFGNANWIAHSPTAGHGVNVDAFYRYQFNLDPAVDPSSLNLLMNFHSDNAVYEVWVNGVAQGIRSNYGAADPYFYNGFSPGTQATGDMNSAWQPGLNTIVVHIKSAPGAQGFMGQMQSTALCLPTISTGKTADPAAGAQVQPGDTLTYTLTTVVDVAPTTEPFVLTDTLGSGLTFGAVTDAGDFACSGELTCTLPAGSEPGTYTVTYTATVNADATGSVGNSVVASGGGGEDPECDPCDTEHEVEPPTISVAKTSDPGSGAQVQPGDTLTYTLTATIATSITTEPLVLTDTLGAGLSFGAVTDAGDFACSGELTCTLPAGTLPGTYAVTYTAIVNANASGTVGNSVVATGGGGDEDPECDPCDTEHEVEAPTIGVVKSSDPGNGTQVQPGDTLTYTLTATIATSVTTEPLVLTDTLGVGLTFGAVTDAGDFACSGELTCTLPAGTLPGTYAVTYTATVNANASGTVGNSVVATGGGGDEDPECVPCETEHEVEAPTIGVVKSSDPGSGAQVQPGDTLTYTLTATIATSATTEPLVLIDTLGAGLTFGAVTDAGAFACSGELTCTLPAGTLPGTYAVTYTATVNADATGTVGNSVVATGGGSDEDPECAPCDTEHEVEAPTIGVVKSSDPGNGTQVQPGDTLTYTLTATIVTSATTEPLVLTDTLGAGLTFGAVTDAGAFVCSGEFTCTLPAGTLPGTYAVTYTATVNADATGSVGNSVVATGGGGDEDPECAPCDTEHEVEAPTIVVAKTADPAAGSEVQPGQTLTYTLTATVAISATTEPLVLTDTLGAGLTFGQVTDAGAFACSSELTCTLPAGTLPGSYAVTYTATVNADATGSVGNSVAATGGGGDEDPECSPCDTEHEVEAPTITIVKSADPAAGAEVRPGDTLTYTLTATVAVSATTEPLVLTDTLGSGLTFGEVTDAGAYACSGELVCTLPAGALPGTYAVTYTATVNADATGSVGNNVAATGGGGDEDPVCDPCETEHEVELPSITAAKTSDPGDGTEVNAGDVITYTLTVTVATSATTEPFVLTDTLSGGQTLLAESIVVPAGGSCEATDSGLICTLAEGSLPGSYAFTYQAQVNPDAVGSVGNAVVGTGGGDPDPGCDPCTTDHPLAEPVITIAKTSEPGDGAEVSVGDTLLYTLTVTVENAALAMPVRLHDTPGTGLTVGELPAGCTGGTGQIVCEVAAGSVPGVYTFTYPATVNADAAGEVNNAVVSEYGGGLDPVCAPCGTTHRVLESAELRIVKTAGARTANIGDLIRYTLTVENVGTVHLVNGTVIDTPPQGFSYVEGSMAVSDADGAFILAPGRYPLRIGGLDIPVGQSATIVYLLRVGAGVRHGTQVNEAVGVNAAGDPISNVATAQVTVEADPLLDDSLIFGTVFDDRDGDGWQDSAKLSGVRVQGGFAPGAYIAGSTTLERDGRSEPVADASAPLLHGISVGALAGRQSEADPVEAHQVVIRQRLREAAFTDDFMLTSDEGVTVRMDAAGQTTVEKSGAAAKGRNAAAPTVERRIAQGEGGVVVDYVIGNAGIDERGIPGVRIASVDGLLIETDQYGRYHLVDVPGGSRGYRNFILKVDPSTLPPGTVLTTDNPLVRRITPGVPVRFDFGVQLPAEAIPGGEEQVELELGEVIFAPGSAQIRDEYRPAIAQIAERVNAYGGGEVTITADGDSEALAFARAEAVREALLAQVDAEHRSALTVTVRTQVHDLVAGATEGGALLGTVLFDTDRSEVKPGYGPLLDQVAARLERLGGGTVAVVGHTDVRGSHAYNTALGMRRARAVYEALAERLSPELRAQVRVESSNDPTAPVGPERK